MNRTRETTLALALVIWAPLACADGLLAVDNPARNGSATLAYADGQLFEGNDQIAMRQYGKDWQGDYAPRSGRNIGLFAARAETGAQWQGYRLGLLYRGAALAQMNRDSADLMRQNKTRSGYDAGRTYAVDGQISGFEADGARLSKSFQLNGDGAWRLEWGAGLSLLRGKRVRIDSAGGQMAALSTRDVNAAATWDTVDSRTNTTGLGRFNPPYDAHPAWSGQGYALDLGTVLHLQNGLTLEAAVNDLAGRMAWKNLPSYIANYNTATKSYDADGFVQFDATATSRSRYRDLSQRLDPKLWLAAAYPAGPFALRLAASRTAGYWFPELGLSYRLAYQWQASADYDVRFKTVGVALRRGGYHFGLRTDNIHLGQAKAYGVHGGVNLPF